MPAQAGPGVLVVGGGAAGIVAATEAALAGAEVLLLERGAQLGIKILVSGGGHCNVTTSLPTREASRLFGKEAESFLRHALRACRPEAVREWLQHEGVETYEAEFEKIWPVSMRARDVRDALQRRLEKSGARLRTHTRVLALARAGEAWELTTEDGEVLRAAQVILATGGKSYPKTGTVGDGYEWLRSLGVPMREPVPGLAPLASEATWARELSGLTLEDVEVQLRSEGGRIEWRRRRPLLFTHHGVSGPGPMDASARIEKEPGRYRFHVDLLPEWSEDELRRELFERSGQLATRLRSLGIARRLAKSILSRLELSDIDSAQVSRPQRRSLLAELKGMEIPVRRSLGFDHAEITAGGVLLDAIDPRSMELRAHPGLYVTGELIDADGPIGGLSFWLAFATGALAGRSAASRFWV
jgi:predicted Rossmann fold flavoprotein